MSLQLSITKHPSSEVVTQLSHCFDQNGGSIGRAEKNDWILPDKDRYVSSVHARIQLKDGQYELIDQSTNGVFLNNSKEPLGSANPVKLQNGDSLKMGGYEIQVSLMLADTGFDDLLSGDAGEVASLDPLAALGAESEMPTPVIDVPTTEPVDDLDRWLEPDNNAALPWETESTAPNLQDIAPTLDPPLSPQITNRPDVINGPQSDLLDIVSANSKSQELDPLALLDSQSMVDDLSPAMEENWQGSSQPQDVDPINEPMQLGGLIPDDWDDDLLTPAPVEAVSVVVESASIAVGLPEAEQPQIPAESIEKTFVPIQEKPSVDSLLDLISKPVESIPELASVIPDEVGPIIIAPEPNVPNVAAPEPVTVPAVVPPPRLPPSADSISIINALGLNAKDLSSEQISNLNHVVGSVVKESVSGLMQVLGARAAIKNEFRMAATLIQAAENNPLKFSVNVDEAMETLFVRESKAYMGSVEAIHDGFEDVKNHQLAMLTGMRAAFQSMFGRFDPEKLQARFEADGVSGMTASGRKAKYWEAFEKYYRSWAEDQDMVFHELFGDDFVEAYEQQMEQLKSE